MKISRTKARSRLVAKLPKGSSSIRYTRQMLVRISSAIPTGTTGTLPVTLTLNGNTRHRQSVKQ